MTAGSFWGETGGLEYAKAVKDNIKQKLKKRKILCQ